jgi:hypothetical protein
MKPKALPHWPTPFVVAVALCTASQGLAQSSASDKALAEALFDEGRRLMDEKDYAHACPKFERSQELANGIGTLLYLADCYEKNGQFASAWATFREAASRANARGETERERIAVRRAGVLEPMLAKLTIVVASGAETPGLSVTRNSHRVERELWGLPSPVDPGVQALDAVAPGKEPWHGSITMSDGEARVVTIPALLDAPAPSAPAVAPLAPAPAGAAPAATHAPAPPAQTNGQRTAAYTIGALGVVGLGVGVAYGLAAKSSNNTADAHCARPGGLCDSQGVAAGQDASRHAVVSNLAFSVGTAGVLGAVVLYFTAPSQHASAAAGWRMTAGVGNHGAQVALLGPLP